MKKGPNLLMAPTCVGLDQPSITNIQTNFNITKFSLFFSCVLYINSALN